ncbi:MAG: tRNA (guanosine(37)-N1)-methyltransferase TrmD [FCB group bacterium]|nr:tRNA (guanosine(37)-N1)-methyltransferase TrmD [FCB group bacterium]
MIRIHFLTPFAKMVEAVITESILGRAASKGYVMYEIHDLFTFADAPHYKIDDYQFGGGSGMVMKPEPIFRAYDDVLKDMPAGTCPRVIFPTPDGRLLNHAFAMELSREENLIFINGHYKGIDQRVRDEIVTDEISIGDYVLTGGELPTLVILDSMIRLIPGVLNSYESAQTDSFTSGLLDYPHYTRPEKFRGHEVPKILMSGHHKMIADWRLEKQKEKTRERRSDLWKKYLASQEIGVKNG